MKSVDNRGQSYIVQNAKVVIDLSVKNQEIAQVNNLFKEADMMFNKLLRNPSGRSDLLTENSLKSKINQFDSNARLTPETFQNYSPAINSNKLSQYVQKKPERNPS